MLFKRLLENLENGEFNLYKAKIDLTIAFLTLTEMFVIDLGEIKSLSHEKAVDLLRNYGLNEPDVMRGYYQISKGNTQNFDEFIHYFNESELNDYQTFQYLTTLLKGIYSASTTKKKIFNELIEKNIYILTEVLCSAGLKNSDSFNAYFLIQTIGYDMSKTYLNKLKILLEI